MKFEAPFHKLSITLQEIGIPDVVSGGCSLDLVESRLWSVGTLVHDSNGSRDPGGCVLEVVICRFVLPSQLKINTPKGNADPAVCGLEVLVCWLFDNAEVNENTGGRVLEVVV